MNVSKGDAFKAYMYIISSHFYSPVVSALRKLNNMASHSSAINAKLFKLSRRDISLNVTQLYEIDSVFSYQTRASVSSSTSSSGCQM